MFIPVASTALSWRFGDATQQSHSLWSGLSVVTDTGAKSRVASYGSFAYMNGMIDMVAMVAWIRV